MSKPKSRPTYVGQGFPISAQAKCLDCVSKVTINTSSKRDEKVITELNKHIEAEKVILK